MDRSWSSVLSSPRKTAYEFIIRYTLLEFRIHLAQKARKRIRLKGLRASHSAKPSFEGLNLDQFHSILFNFDSDSVDYPIRVAVLSDCHAPDWVKMRIRCSIVRILSILSVWRVAGAGPILDKL
jgi:hypothetical protein